MTSKTVQSPAGENIELVDDDEWVKLTGSGPGGLRQWKIGRKPELIRALWEHGEFINKSGQATRDLMTYMVDHYELDGLSSSSGSLPGIMNLPLNFPAFERVARGKRTYNIKLVAMPETWHRKLMEDIGPGKPSSNGDQTEIPKPFQRFDTESQPEDMTDADWDAIKLDAPTVFEEPAPLEVHIANQVAISLLQTVVEIITAGNADTTQLSGSQRLQDDLDHARELLAARLGENDKLRRQVREAGDIISALKVERDGLRSRLRMTENNLKEVLKGETAQAVNAEIHKRVDQIMRTAPGTPKGD